MAKAFVIAVGNKSKWLAYALRDQQTIVLPALYKRHFTNGVADHKFTGYAF